MLPVNLLESWLMRWQELYVDRALEIHTPAELAQIANAVRVLIEKSDTSQTNDPVNFNKQLDGAPAIGTLIFGGMPIRIIEDKIKQSMPKLIEAPYLADILETDGIFSFPNRIWRKDLIAKIRSGD